MIGGEEEPNFDRNSQKSYYNNQDQSGAQSNNSMDYEKQVQALNDKNQQFINYAQKAQQKHYSDNQDQYIHQMKDKETGKTILVSDWIQRLIEITDQHEIQEYFEKYIPQSKTFDMEYLKHSKNARIKRYKTGMYYGIINDGQKAGLGIMAYFNGRLFEGGWDLDKKHGKGIELYQNGGRFDGHFIGGKKDGKGQFRWPNNEIYDGEWKAGFKHGSGFWRGPKGDSYVGEWKEGKADGFGVHTWINGDRYEGEFRTCLKNGLGTEKFANGDIYKGNYDNGKPEGYGEYYWANGNQYKGYFVNGLRHGRGIWKSSNEGGDVYEGEYRNDKKCGYGEYRWASGNVFKGNFENDLRHGYGEMYWTDGKIYKGYWMNGIQVGEVGLDLSQSPIPDSKLNGSVLNSQHMTPQKSMEKYRSNISPKSNGSDNVSPKRMSRKLSKDSLNMKNSRINLPQIQQKQPQLTSHSNSTQGSRGRRKKPFQDMTIDDPNSYMLPEVYQKNDDCYSCNKRQYKTRSPNSGNVSNRNLNNYNSRDKVFSIDQVSCGKQSKKSVQPWRPGGVPKNFNPLGYDLTIRNQLGGGYVPQNNNYRY